MNWTLITGASHNLGAYLAVSLAKQGQNILIHYNKSRANAETVALSCRSFGVQADIIQGDFSDREGVESFLRTLHQQFPDIKILINNVGTYLQKSALTTTLKEWERMFQENLFVSVALALSLAPSIKERKGNMINIGACGLGIKANACNTAYAAAKTALLIFTKSLAQELAPSQVPVNMVSPGQLEQSIVEVTGIPMGRDGSFEDLANAILFLLKDSSRYITGQNIEVAGGLLL